MVKFESPVGSRTFESTGMKHFTVENAEDEYAQNTPSQQSAKPAVGMPVRMSPEEAMAMRRRMISEAQSRSGVEDSNTGANVGANERGNSWYQPSKAAKRRIEMLVGIGRQTLDVEVATESGSAVFSLRTLKSKEMRSLVNIASMLAKAEDPDAIYAIREASLALAIYAIDGVPIDVILDTQGLAEPARVAARKDFLDDMDEHTLNYIFIKHEELVASSAKQFGVHSAADAKEVAEELKKSSKGT